MKNLKFFLPFAAIGLLASCSNDNLEAPAEGTTPGASQELAPGTYMNIAITIPSNGTRATGSAATFADGTEYAVHDATLYVFDDDGGKPGNLKGYLSLDGYFNAAGNGTSEITGTTTITEINVETETLKLEKKSGTDYWALVILNSEGLKVGTTTNLPTGAVNFYTWAATQTESPMIVGDNEYFTMTNALGWDLQSTNKNNLLKAAPNHLALITSNDLYRESEPAPVNPVRIYVQRAVSKVTIKEADNYAKISDDKTKAFPINIKKGGNGQDKDDIIQVDFLQLESWYLDVTNKFTYPVQLLETSNENTKWYGSWITSDASTDWSTAFSSGALNRFITSNTTAPKFQRLYWAVDPNYAYAEGSDWKATTDNGYPFNVYTATTNSNVKKNDHSPAYCLENTFAVASMNQLNSTRIVFEGTYYAKVGTTSATTSLPNNAVATDLISYNGKYISLPADKPYIKVNGTPDEKGQIAANALLGIDESKLGETTAQDAQTALETFNKELHKVLNLSEASDTKVNYHPNGKVYYIVIIRHFNDDELDLLAQKDKLGDDLNYVENEGLTLLAQSYPDHLDEYLLGRYGMVRNNWYEIGVKGVAGPGSPILPPPTTTTDDEPAKLLLDVEINILAWAKRGQDVTLGK